MAIINLFGADLKMWHESETQRGFSSKRTVNKYFQWQLQTYQSVLFSLAIISSC